MFIKKGIVNGMSDFIKKNKKVIKEMFLYGVIGVMSAGIDFGIFAFLKSFYVTNVFIANFISINMGMIFSFFMNTFFNFKMTDKLLKRAIKFFAVAYFGMVLSMIILFLGNKVLKFDSLVVKMVSIVIVAMVQFVLNKITTFKDK